MQIDLVRYLLSPIFFFFLMIRRPPRSTPLYSSAASDVYKRQAVDHAMGGWFLARGRDTARAVCRVRPAAGTGHHGEVVGDLPRPARHLSLIHISEPTRRTPISYAVFCLKKKNQKILS